MVFEVHIFDLFSGLVKIKYMRKIDLQHVVWKEGNYYVAQCLNVDVSSFGKTKKEALVNLQEALELYFEDTKPKQIIKVQRPKIVMQEFEYA